MNIWGREERMQEKWGNKEAERGGQTGRDKGRGLEESGRGEERWVWRGIGAEEGK